MLDRRMKLRAIVVIGGLIACSAQAEQGSLTCQTRCSETKLRTGIAELTWSGPAGAGTTRGQQTLDVSVFHRGFERGLYQSFGKIGERSTPLPDAGASRDAQSDKRTLRAYELTLRQSDRSPDTPARSATEVLQRIEIENVEPGLLYRFRLRDGGMGTQEVACEAPICPADMKEGR